MAYASDDPKGQVFVEGPVPETIECSVKVMDNGSSRCDDEKERIKHIHSDPYTVSSSIQESSLVTDSSILDSSVVESSLLEIEPEDKENGKGKGAPRDTKNGKSKEKDMDEKDKDEDGKGDDEEEEEEEKPLEPRVDYYFVTLAVILGGTIFGTLIYFAISKYVEPPVPVLDKSKLYELYPWLNDTGEIRTTEERTKPTTPPRNDTSFDNSTSSDMETSMSNPVTEENKFLTTANAEGGFDLDFDDWEENN